MVAASAATRLLSGLLFGITPLDPATIVGVAIVLVGVSAAACYVPARSVAGIDPVRDGVQIGPVPGTSEPSVSFGVTAARALESGTLDGFWANGMGTEVAVRRGIGGSSRGRGDRRLSS